MTNKQATIDGLLACGFTEEVGRSSKYRCFNVPDGIASTTNAYLVGKAGALRALRGSNTAISGSVSKTDTKIHKAYQYVGRLSHSIAAISAQGFREIMVRHARGEINE